MGSGPAGYTAAIYAARAELKPVLFASSLAPGGALMNTTRWRTSPGFIQGIQGPELMENIGQQAERFGADIRYQDVEKVELTGDVKKVYTADGAVHLAKTVIMTTGSQVRKLNIEGEDRLSGYGVSWCATCDGFFFKDKEIAVVGGGDSALEEALFLTTSHPRCTWCTAAILSALRKSCRPAFSTTRRLRLSGTRLLLPFTARATSSRSP